MTIIKLLRSAIASSFSFTHRLFCSSAWPTYISPMRKVTLTLDQCNSMYPYVICKYEIEFTKFVLHNFQLDNFSQSMPSSICFRSKEETSVPIVISISSTYHFICAHNNSNHDNNKNQAICISFGFKKVPTSISQQKHVKSE